MVKNTMPNPPIHCVSDRQKSSPAGSTSTLSITVAPVVVKPDMFSKKASVKLLRYPLMMKGRVPKRENKIQAVVTTR